MPNAATASTLPPAYVNPVFSDSARGVALDIANALAALPMLREQMQVLRDALEAAKRDNADLRAQLEIARAANKLSHAIIDQLSPTEEKRRDDGEDDVSRERIEVAL